MKTIFSAFFLTMFSATAAYAQTAGDIPNAILCCASKPGDTITYAELIKCDELTHPSKEVKVKSFKLSFAVSEGAGALYHEYNNTGGKLSKEVKDVLSTLESKRVKKLLIENVVVLTPRGDIRNIKGIDVNLKK